MSLQKYAKHILYSEYFSVANANLYTKKSFCKFFINYFSLPGCVVLRFLADFGAICAEFCRIHLQIVSKKKPKPKKL